MGSLTTAHFVLTSRNPNFLHAGRVDSYTHSTMSFLSLETQHSFLKHNNHEKFLQ